MFKLVALVVLVAVCRAAPKPGYLHGALPLAYPVATSHSSRIDIHSKPIAVVTAPLVHAPLIHAPIVAAPIVKTYAPIVKTIIPAAVSHSSRYDVHSAPLVTGYYGGLGHGSLGYGHGVSLGYGGYGGYGGHGLYGHY